MTRALTATLAVLLLVPAAAGAKKPGFTAGAAKVLANPATPVCLGGYGACTNGAGRTMTHVKDDLYARALAIGDRKGGSFILVHTTNIGLFASYKADGVGIYHLRQEVARRTGVPADHAATRPIAPATDVWVWTTS
jgi:hypothetical protein